MATVADVLKWVEGFAPRRLAESWDNVGLLMGDPASPVHKIMTCLTVTARTAAEAVEQQAEVIVSHHPVLFKATKNLRADRSETAPVWTLARAGVAVISPHTSFDNTEGGINDLIASRLGLSEVVGLRPGASGGASRSFKVVVFTPESDRHNVLSAAFQAGAGRIGNYDECSFSTEGVGTFFGNEASHPTLGVAGNRETAAEWRVEFVCPTERLDRVLAAVRQAHSYEEVAIDVYPVADNRPSSPGAGRVGQLAETETLAAFVQRVKRVLRADPVQFVGDPNRPVRRVALCCGAGDDFLLDAIALGADLLLTGEARFHRALEAESSGIGLVLAGHHATERPGVEDLADRLERAFPDLNVWASESESDPLQVLPL